MKNTIALIDANIENLTSLWKTVGIPFDAYLKTPLYEYCEIKNSEWPNRFWLNQNVNQNTLTALKEKLASTTTDITIPIWNIYNKNDDALFEENGFKVKFEQIGMSLKLEKALETNSSLKIKRVNNLVEVKLWAALFLKSFGYTIADKTILKTITEVDYYIAYDNDIAVGTAMLYKTDTIAGVHSVGIPPEMRRKGYAKQIMELLINMAVENQYQYITLQASSMGRGLYLQLGFKEQFLIKNYCLAQ